MEAGWAGNQSVSHVHRLGQASKIIVVEYCNGVFKATTLHPVTLQWSRAGRCLSLSSLPTSSQPFWEFPTADQYLRVRRFASARSTHAFILYSQFQPPTMVRKLQVAVSGLGRMGARHALHFLGKTVSRRTGHQLQSTTLY